jgi:hypothetical protein
MLALTPALSPEERENRHLLEDILIASLWLLRFGIAQFQTRKGI